MKRAGDKSRKRVLNDDELRSVWKQAGSAGTFGAFVKMLLPAQRRDKVLRMCWADISDDDVWTIPTEEREKGKAKSVKLLRRWQQIGLLDTAPATMAMSVLAGQLIRLERHSLRF